MDPSDAFAPALNGEVHLTLDIGSGVLMVREPTGEAASSAAWTTSRSAAMAWSCLPSPVCGESSSSKFAMKDWVMPTVAKACLPARLLEELPLFLPEPGVDPLIATCFPRAFCGNVTCTGPLGATSCCACPNHGFSNACCGVGLVPIFFDRHACTSCVRFALKRDIRLNGGVRLHVA